MLSTQGGPLCRESVPLAWYWTSNLQKVTCQSCSRLGARMTLVQFAAPDDTTRPLCDLPVERDSWLWAVDPREVTCPRCADLIRKMQDTMRRDTAHPS